MAESNQLNLTVVALVALVAIVGLVALVMNAASVKQLATGSKIVSAESTNAPPEVAQRLASGDYVSVQKNVAGDMRAQTVCWCSGCGRGGTCTGSSGSQECEAGGGSIECTTFG